MKISVEGTTKFSTGSHLICCQHFVDLIRRQDAVSEVVKSYF